MQTLSPLNFLLYSAVFAKAKCHSKMPMPASVAVLALAPWTMQKQTGFSVFGLDCLWSQGN